MFTVGSFPIFTFRSGYAAMPTSSIRTCSIRAKKSARDFWTAWKSANRVVKRWSNNTTHYVEDALPQKAKWARVECDFPNIKGSNTSDDPVTKDIYTLAANPGE